MINGEYRNGNNTLSSDEDMSLAVSASICKKNIVSTNKKNLTTKGLITLATQLLIAVTKYVALQCGRRTKYGRQHVVELLWRNKSR